MGRPITLFKLLISIIKSAITSFRSSKKIYIYKIFLESKKFIRLISECKNSAAINEFSSDFGKYKTRRISWDILKPYSYCY